VKQNRPRQQKRPLNRGFSLPDTDELAAYLASAPAGVRLREIARAFDIPPQGRAALRKQLADMSLDSGQTDSQSTLLCEVCKIDDEGMAWAQPVTAGDAEPLPIALSSAQRTPASGQRFIGRIITAENQSYIDVMRIMGAQKQSLFGRLISSKSGWLFESAHKGAPQLIEAVDVPGLSLEENCLVEAVALSGHGRVRRVRPVRNLGSIFHPDAFASLAIAEYELPHTFSDEAIRQADNATLSHKESAEDITHIPIVTIDGEDAKDFDDGVFAEPLEDGNWRLIVGIADVGAYVTADSVLDREARLRGNSVYLPGTVIPMLPEALSNGLCSLLPRQDRACLCVEMVITPEGIKQSHRFFRAIIHSHARLTYHQVQNVIDGVHDEADLDVPAGTIYNLVGAYHCLRAARQARGALELNIAEAKILFDDNDKPVAVETRHQREANQLIEEFMILANISAAETLEEARKICVYRVHDRPDPQKLDTLFELTDSMGVAFAKGQVISPAVLNQLLARVKDSQAEMAINEAVLRCQARAVYDISNIGHYGLGLARYAHFTSPIRRYADLLVHRALISHIEASPQLLGTEQTKDIAVHISQTEQRAAKAERRTVARFAALLSHSLEGSQAEVVITGVVAAGLFVRLEDGITEGFIHRKTLPEDYYDIADAGMSLVGKNLGWHFTVGMTIEASILNVEIASGGVTLRWFAGGKQILPELSGTRRRTPRRPKHIRKRPKRQHSQ